MKLGVGHLVDERYELVGVLGRGGSGEVFDAVDRQTGEPVALKVLKESNADELSRRRFKREMKGTALLRHPNIVRVLETGEDDGALYLVMERLKGSSLLDLTKDGPISVARACRLVKQLLTGLSAAHTAGLLHRDLKPENVIVDANDQLKILDFGILRYLPHSEAGLTASTLTAEGKIIGTPKVMSPEQIRRQPLDGRADLYSVGVILFELLTGRLPFPAKGHPSGVLHAHLRKQPPSPSSLREEVPPWLDALVLSLLEKSADRRPASAAEVLGILEAHMPPPRATVPVGQVGRFLLAGLIVLGVMIGLATFGKLVPEKPPPASFLRIDPVRVGAEEASSEVGMAIRRVISRGLRRGEGRRVILEGSAPEAIASTLSVQEGVYLLELSLWRDGERVWVQPWRGPDLVSILTRAVPVAARQVSVTLSEPLLETEDPAAWMALARARYLLDQAEKASNAAGVAATREAESLSPGLAPASAIRAQLLLQAGRQRWQTPADAWPQSRTAAEQALSLQPALVDARRTLAEAVLFETWDWPAARQVLDLAEKDHRDDPDLLATRARWDVCGGGTSDALERLRELAPEEGRTRLTEAYVAFYSGAFEQVVAQDLSETDEGVWLTSRALEGLGRREEAIIALETAIARRPSLRLRAERIRISGLLGDQEGARVGLVSLRSAEIPVGPMQEALILQALGEEEAALSALGRAVAEHDSEAWCLASDPAFASLQDAPGFEELLDALGGLRR